MALDITSYLLGKKGSGGASGLKVVVVEELPQTGEANILYLVPKTTTGTNNIFEEYLYINENWELIGTTDIDLSNYIQKSLTAGLVKNDGTIDTSTYLTQEVPEVYCQYQTSTSNPLVLDGQKKGIMVLNDASGYLYYKAKSTSSYSSSISSCSARYIIFFEDINIDTMTKNKNIGLVNYWAAGVNTIGYLYLNSSNQLSINTTTVIGYGINYSAQTWGGVKTFVDIPRTQNTTAPTLDNQLTNKKYVDNTVAPSVTTSSTSTYTISSLSENKVYKLGEITSLTISAVTTFDRESVIYFESGSTATDITIPTSLDNIGDVPTLTTSGDTNTGTCATNKKYIISVLNNIAVWKEY